MFTRWVSLGNLWLEPRLVRLVRIQNNKLKDAKMHLEVIILNYRHDRNIESPHVWSKERLFKE